MFEWLKSLFLGERLSKIYEFESPVNEDCFEEQEKLDQVSAEEFWDKLRSYQPVSKKPDDDTDFDDYNDPGCD